MTLITLILAFLIMLLVLAGMAIGVVFGRQPISGTCGGLSALGNDANCEICGGNPAACDAGTVKKTTSNPSG